MTRHGNEAQEMQDRKWWTKSQEWIMTNRCLLIHCTTKGTGSRGLYTQEGLLYPGWGQM